MSGELIVSWTDEGGHRQGMMVLREGRLFVLPGDDYYNGELATDELEKLKTGLAIHELERVDGHVVRGPDETEEEFIYKFLEDNPFFEDRVDVLSSCLAAELVDEGLSETAGDEFAKEVVALVDKYVAKIEKDKPN